jgi:hypothetical protein
MHRGACLDGRRHCQGGKPEGRRSRPHRLRRRLLFHDVQRQQAVDHRQPEIRPRPGAGQGDGEEGRCLHRELRARRGRAARARLRCRQRDQPEHHLCPGQGLRRRQPVREGAVIRPDRTSRWRGDEHHRRARRQAGQTRPDDRRHRHWYADGVQHRQRSVRSCAHRQGPAAAGGDAGLGHALQPRHVHHTSAHRRRRARPATTRLAASIRASPAAPTITFTC